MKVKIEAFEIYPAGVYPVTVREITLDADNQYGAQFRFKFELGGALNGKTLTGWCHQSGSVKSKFFEWYGALTGSAPKTGEEVDTDLLIGRTAQAVIKVKLKEDGTQKNVIDSLLPISASPVNARVLFLSFEQAKEYAEANGITAEELKDFLKSQGLTKFAGSRDSELVYEFVAASNIAKTEEAF